MLINSVFSFSDPSRAGRKHIPDTNTPKEVGRNPELGERVGIGMVMAWVVIVIRCSLVVFGGVEEGVLGTPTTRQSSRMPSGCGSRRLGLFVVAQ